MVVKPYLIAYEVSESITSSIVSNPPIGNFIYSSILRDYVTNNLDKEIKIPL